MEPNPLDTYSPFDRPEPPPPPKQMSKPIKSDQPDIDDEELRAYEQRLNILESKLNSQETQIAVAQQSGKFHPQANWPSFYPIVYFNIEDVPTPLRSFVNNALFAWCIMTLAFAVNFFACLSLLSAGRFVRSPGSKISLAALYLFMFVPLGLNFNALSVYQALRTDISTIKFIKMFLSLAATVILESVLTLGFDDSGSCGLITMLNLFNEHQYFPAILGLFDTLLLGFAALQHSRLLDGLWKFYRGTEQGEHLETDVRNNFSSIVLSALR